MSQRLIIHTEQQSDGHWLARVPQLPGVQAHGRTRPEAVAGAKARSLRVLADRLEAGQNVPNLEPLITEQGPEHCDSAPEHEHLARAGALLAADVWEPEDFSDWEGSPDDEAGAR